MASQTEMCECAEHGACETPDPKIKTAEELDAIVRSLRAEGKTIAQCSGCFILTHIGHVKHLKFAKSLADVLIVSTNTDRSLVDVRRDKNRFYVNQYDRAEMLAALSCVDYVTFFDEETADNLVLRFKPDFFVKGADYSGGRVREIETVESYGGKIVISHTPKLWSSTHFLHLMTTEGGGAPANVEAKRL
jgi:rfaE bifunctional protein nucleotidyltransferase chain/domain